MLHTFVDTNVFLSLYAYTDDNIDELRKLLHLMKGGQLKLYVTTVVNQEFNRNRDRKIQESFGNLEKFSTALSVPRFVEHIDEASQIRELLKVVAEKKAALLSKAKEEIRGLSLAADTLFKEIRNEAQLIGVSDEADRLARKRLERSNPPGKSGDLGDRLNWELLLEHVPDQTELHIVSRDKDYSSPFGADIPNSYLVGEWEVVKSAKLHLYSGLRSFAKSHFPEIELAADVEKKLAIKALVQSKSFWSTHAAIAKLAPHSADISSDEASELFSALLSNSEIYLISSDNDVKGFYEGLLVDHWSALSSEDYKKVTEYVQDPIPF